MGALHQGHISLVERCRKECDTVVVSIFVNPTQFNDPTDLEKYPRTEELDLEMLRKAGVDIVFAPSVIEVYPEPDKRQFEFGALEQLMEGASRPGHFNGVAQVVSRLFDIVKPQKAYFGEKDFQQLAVIRSMTRTLGYPIEIIGCPIIREADGLAMSSRNTLLTPDQRAAAPWIYRVIRELSQKCGTIEELQEWGTQQINTQPHLKAEYVTIAEPNTLQPPTEGQARHIFVAVRCGSIRLIDNIATTKCK